MLSRTSELSTFGCSFRPPKWGSSLKFTMTPALSVPSTHATYTLRYLSLVWGNLLSFPSSKSGIFLSYFDSRSSNLLVHWMTPSVTCGAAFLAAYWPTLHFSEISDKDMIWRFTFRHGTQRTSGSLRQLEFLFRSSKFRTSCQSRILVSTSFSPPFHCCSTSLFPHSVNSGFYDSLFHSLTYWSFCLPVNSIALAVFFWAIMWRFHISPPFFTVFPRIYWLCSIAGFW